MLDFVEVKRQINRMAREQKDRRKDFSERVARAFEELARWDSQWEALADKVIRSRTSWLVARLSEGLRTAYPCPQRPKQLTVLATDGSQIFPDRHEISSCYLINIGSIVFHYGTLKKPQMTHRPALFYKEADMYQPWGGRRIFINAEMVSARRTQMELEELARLGQEAVKQMCTAVALSDGTLILWPLEGTPEDFRQDILNAALRAFDTLRDAEVPLTGYISHPGSTDVVNVLRVGLCPLDAPDCDRCPWKAEGPPQKRRSNCSDQETEPLYNATPLPCESIEGMTDGLLFARLLKVGERSAVFGSESRILKEYGPHRVMFFYVNVGFEVARVEVPRWVAEDEEQLRRVHTCVVDQTAKGNGYPIALSEAHERAIIRGTDRDLFYKVLGDTFVQHDIRAEISRKSFQKRSIGI